MRSLLILSGLVWGTQAFAADLSVADIYGSKIEFDVLRDGAVVGEHITRFEQTGDQLVVMSSMKVELKLLFMTVYSFNYKAREVWRKDDLQSLNVAVYDDGESKAFSGKKTADEFIITNNGAAYALPAAIYTTNHWNEGVVAQTKVLNTLTGKLNKVTIIPQGLETINVRGGEIEASRYDYTGELRDTSVWYDQAGRWVKLEFKAEDGSTISYKCRNCLESGLPKNTARLTN